MDQVGVGEILVDATELVLGFQPLWVIGASAEHDSYNDIVQCSVLMQSKQEGRGFVVSRSGSNQRN